MDSIFSTFGIVASVLFGYMCLWFIASLVKKRNDVADIAWGLGFILVALLSLFLTKTVSLSSVLVTFLVIIWGIRLALHIYLRNKGKPEDKRYAAWRVEWGKWVVLRSFFQVFILQGLLLFIIAIPIVLVNISTPKLSPITIAGLIVWLIGFYFESVGDKQLKNFLSDPTNKGKVLNTGLWKYTRHPNYFGEVTMWWGIWLISLSSPLLGALSIVGPLTITFLILKVSGVPMLEKNMTTNPLFQDYIKTTSKFLPWWPKSIEIYK